METDRLAQQVQIWQHINNIESHWFLMAEHICSIWVNCPFKAHDFLVLAGLSWSPSPQNLFKPSKQTSLA